MGRQFEFSNLDPELAAVLVKGFTGLAAVLVKGFTGTDLPGLLFTDAKTLLHSKGILSRPLPKTNPKPTVSPPPPVGGVRCVRQYPGEKEITFPPYTCLESDGDPRVERSAQGEVVIFPLKVASRTPPPPRTHEEPPFPTTQ